jgi:hypothetical protein
MLLAAPGSRRALAEALFERVEVLGLRRMRIEPTPSAIAAGLVDAFSRASAGYGRGERSRPRGTYLICKPSAGLALTMSTETSTAGIVPRFSSQWFVVRSSGQPTPGP